MMYRSLSSRVSIAALALIGLDFLSVAGAAPSVAAAVPSVVKDCTNYTGPQFVCMNRYASLMPPVFQRVVDDDISNPDTFPSTKIPSDKAFQKVANANFLIWNEKGAAGVLGSNPTYDFMFSVSGSGHEAPVYAPNTNELYFSQLSTGYLSQFVVNLSKNPPTLSTKTANPPIYAPAGARYRNGLIYFAATGGNSSLGSRTYRPGIYTLDPKTGKSATVLNNYYGYYFNTCDDLDIDSQGRIWFTDILFSRNVGTNTEAPQLEAATYRYDPATGHVGLVEDSAVAPNGIAFSPDGNTLYLTDTGAGVPDIDPTISPPNVPSLSYNATDKRSLYAYDVTQDGMHIQNKRALYSAIDFAPDGLKVAQNGYLVTATGHGVDVLDQSGTPLLRIQTNFTAVNIAFAGPKGNELWIVGQAGVARVKWDLQGFLPS